jgi:hypothetical protein
VLPPICSWGESAFLDYIQHKTGLQPWSKQSTERSLKIGMGHRLPVHGKAYLCIWCQVAGDLHRVCGNDGTRSIFKLTHLNRSGIVETRMYDGEDELSARSKE